MKVLMIIPAYNEEESILRTVQGIIDYRKNIDFQLDYLVINDGSTDSTKQILIQNKLNAVHLVQNLGIGGAVQTGYKYALDNDYDVAVQFDGDGQHDIQSLNSLIQPILVGQADMVIGSRFVLEKRPVSLRMMGNILISAAIRLTTGKTINDPTSGMRMFSEKLIKEFALNINYGPEPDTVSYLIRQGVKVAEAQVYMQDRQAGESYLTLSRSVQYMMHMFASILIIQNFRKRG